MSYWEQKLFGTRDRKIRNLERHQTHYRKKIEAQAKRISELEEQVESIKIFNRSAAKRIEEASDTLFATTHGPPFVAVERCKLGKWSTSDADPSPPLKGECEYAPILGILKEAKKVKQWGEAVNDDWELIKFWIKR